MADMENNEMMDELEMGVLELTDEEGNDITFEMLDVIDYEGGRYLVLQDPEDENYVVIMKETEISEDESTFTELDDQDLLEKIFELFKERNQDLDFEDEE